MATTILDTFITQFDFRSNRAALRLIEQDVAGTTRKIDKSAALAFTAVGAAIGTIAIALTSATRKSIEWESSFTGVRKTVEATEAGFAKLEQQLLKLSTTSVPIDPNELAEVAEAAGQLGIQTDHIASFTETMAQLGVTTNLSAQEAATQLARFANVTGLSQDQFDRLGATIVHLGNNFATTEAEIVAMASRMAGTGTTVGLLQSEILGFATAFSSVGIQAELGGTAFSRIAGEMAKAVELGGDDLQGFADIANMSAAAFAQLFGEAPAKALEVFIGGVRQMREEGKGVIAPLEELGFSGVRVRETILKASTAFDLMREAVSGAGQAWAENSALQKEAELRFGTTESKIQFAANATDRLQITLGKIVQPHVNDFLDTFAYKMGALNEKVVENEESITSFVDSLIAVSKIRLGVTGDPTRTRDDTPSLAGRTGANTTWDDILSYIMEGSSTDFNEGFFQWRGFTGARGRAGANIRADNKDNQSDTSSRFDFSAASSNISSAFNDAKPSIVETIKEATTEGVTAAVDLFPESEWNAIWSNKAAESLREATNTILRGEAFSSVGITGGEFGQSGLDEYLDDYEAQLTEASDGLLDDLVDDLEGVKANILGLNVAFDQTGLSVGFAQTKSQRWSQGLADLGGALINVVSQTSEWAAAGLSVVQGAITGGPMGAVAAGLNALSGVLFGSAEASGAAAWEERKRAMALRDTTTALAALSARESGDPEGLGAERSGAFARIADFISTISADTDFGEGGRFEQFFQALGKVDDVLAGGNRAALGTMGSRLLALYNEFAHLFGDVTAVEFGEKFLSSDLFQQLFGTEGDGTTPSTPGGATYSDLPPVSPTAATYVGGTRSFSIDIDEIIVNAQGGDAEQIASSIRASLVDELNNLVENLDTDVQV